MPTINYCKHVKWDGDRCYVECFCRDLTPNEHYTIHALYNGKPKASWGFRPRGISYTATGYIVGDKIDGGDCNVELRLCFNHDPEDYVAAILIYIPQKVKPTCAQEFYVKDELSGSSINGALCHITSGLWCTTGSNGRCKITLNSGDNYTVNTSKSGYECRDCRKSFTACTGIITLTLKKLPTTANITFDTTPKGAEVRVGDSVIGNT